MSDPITAEAPVGQEAPPGWQPIETAPDATYVLVWVPNYGINVATQTKHPTGDHWWLRDHADYCHPTHWMPLPAAPLPSQASPDRKER
jgi:hypothetical protein